MYSKYSKEEFEKVKKQITDKYNNDIEFEINDFRNIIKILRNKEWGCTWDSVQTHESITMCLIEECYEVIEAIKDKDDSNLKEELGDVLMQIVMHSEMACERECFEFNDVVGEISRKMIKRHPKIFTEAKGNFLKEELKNKENKLEENLSLWEKIKAEEKKGSKEAEKGPLNRVATSLPALIRAQKVIKKSDQMYGDSSEVSDSIKELKNNIEKLEKAFEERPENKAKNRDEKVEKYSNIDEILGTILLEITNIAYRLEENAENSLTKSIEEFINKREINKNIKSI